MKATANNSNAVLLICVAYTSCDEIVHAVEESCKEKRKEIQAPNGGKFDREAGLGTNTACNGNIERFEKGEKENAMVNHEVASNGLVEEVKESEKQHEKIPNVKLVDVEKHICAVARFGFMEFGLGSSEFQRNHYYLEKKKKQV
ncbi:hypothetical protein M0R45_003840 [Rubus argutus]|uniref:Uncharacterized protein n=1 Tax=Rubus argutus TaxID=59490 RepID=A0AAW1YIB8_RUBAR